jgi:hypothetical protein
MSHAAPDTKDMISSFPTGATNHIRISQDPNQGKTFREAMRKDSLN